MPSKPHLLIDAFVSHANDHPETASTHLDLSNCALSALPPSLTAKPILGITLLNLAHNALNTLPSLNSLPNLRILFLLSNGFIALPPNLATHTSLSMLSFKNNSLTGTLPAKLLPPNLNWLILTSNSLTALSLDFPARCRNVRKLLLSNNNLSSLPPTFATDMPHLELLRLCNNHFHIFPTQLLSHRALKWLSLAGNPCTCRTHTADNLPAELRLRELSDAYVVDWAHPFGSGASGTAFPARHRASSRLVAVKQFAAAAGSDGAALDEIAVSLAARGVPGVVQAEAFCVSTRRGDASPSDVALVSELVPGDARAIAAAPSFASCTRSVYDDAPRLTAHDAARIVTVVTRAVEGLLARGLAHGDVYGHNVIVGTAGPDGIRPVVLGDLGAAWWVPPEALEGVRAMEMRAVQVFSEEVMALVHEER